MKEIPELDTAGLRQFGLTFAAIIAVLFGLIVPFLFKLGFPWWPWIIAVAFTGWSLLAPASLNSFYRLWMRFGLVMNAIVTRIILGIVYYLVVSPIGVMFKIMGKDPMRRATRTKTDTYRVASNPAEPDQMRKPF